jgi:hypothetical protein
LAGHREKKPKAAPESVVAVDSRACKPYRVPPPAGAQRSQISIAGEFLIHA